MLQCFSMESKDATQLNSLTLAFLGDAVFTLFVREKLVTEHDCKSGRLHKMASDYVCAASQARMLEGITPVLTEEEKEVARRCRNCHNPSHAKNAALSDYKKATALEGVLGFLRLTGQNERLNELMNKCTGIIDGGNGNE